MKSTGGGLHDHVQADGLPGYRRRRAVLVPGAFRGRAVLGLCRLVMAVLPLAQAERPNGRSLQMIHGVRNLGHGVLGCVVLLDDMARMGWYPDAEYSGRHGRATTAGQGQASAAAANRPGRHPSDRGVSGVQRSSSAVDTVLCRRPAATSVECVQLLSGYGGVNDGYDLGRSL